MSNTFIDGLAAGDVTGDATDAAGWLKTGLVVVAEGGALWKSSKSSSRETLAAGVGRGLLDAGGAAAGASSPKPPSRSTSWTGAVAGFAGAAGADVDAIRALGAREVVAVVRLDVDVERDGPSS